MDISDGSGYSGTIVVDIDGVRKASAVLADDAHAFEELAARVGGHALPSMPPDIAGRVGSELADAASTLRQEPQALLDTAQELRVRAFWGEIADKLMAGTDLSDAQLKEFKAAYASGLLTRYAEPWQNDLAEAYAKEVQHREHPGGLMGLVHAAGDALSGAWDAIKDPAVMLYHLTPFSDDWQQSWANLGKGLAYGVTHPEEFGKALLNLDALKERGVAYWLGNLAPAVVATIASGGAGAAAKGVEGVTALDRAAEGAIALDRTVEGMEGAGALGRTERALEAVSVGSKPSWLKRLEEGNAFNKERAPFYEHNELYVEQPTGSGYYRVDSYDTNLNEIVSRKHTQLGEVSEDTALRYVRELGAKYTPGTPIADVPSTPPWLRGELLTGKQVLEVPPQSAPIPQTVLDEATRLNIEIRDVNGDVYNATGRATAGAR
jgi:hypothetical protein